MVWEHFQDTDRYFVSDLFYEVEFMLRRPWHHPFAPVHPLALPPEEALERLRQACREDITLHPVLWSCTDLWEYVIPDLWGDFFMDALEREIGAGNVAILRLEKEWWPAPQPWPGTETGTGAGTETGPGPVTDTWFELRVIDEMGVPIPGVELHFAFDRETRVTDGDGRIRIAGVSARFHQTQVRTPPAAARPEPGALDSLRAAVKPRWDEVRPGPRYEPQGDDLVVPLHGDVPIDMSLLSERPRTIVVVPWVVRVRLIGGYFDTNKCFLLPSAVKLDAAGESDMRKVRRHIAENPRSTLLIVGHTDTTGEPEYNDQLSLERAEAVVAYLRHDVNAWLAWYDTEEPREKRWGAREDAAMIQAMPDYPTPPPTSPVRWYQDTRGFHVDGVAGANTRRAIVGEYMMLAGAPLRPETRVVAHGCGESFPLPEQGHWAEVRGKQHSRRVEAYLFDRRLAEEPLPAGDISHAGGGEPPEWQRRSLRSYDYLAPTIAPRLVLRLCDSNRRPYGTRPFHVHFPGVLDQTGRTSVDGTIEIEPPPPLGSMGYVEVTPGGAWGEARYRWDIEVGTFECTSDPRGACVRLANLEYYEGPLATEISPAMRRALRAFQFDARDRTPSGVLDDPTIARLDEAHDRV